MPEEISTNLGEHLKRIIMRMQTQMDDIQRQLNDLKDNNINPLWRGYDGLVQEYHSNGLRRILAIETVIQTHNERLNSIIEVMDSVVDQEEEERPAVPPLRSCAWRLGTGPVQFFSEGFDPRRNSNFDWIREPTYDSGPAGGVRTGPLSPSLEVRDSGVHIVPHNNPVAVEERPASSVPLGDIGYHIVVRDDGTSYIVPE